MNRKLALITAFILLTYSSYSQTNLDFENWIDKGPYQDPVGWNTSNIFSELGANINCIKSNPHWGNSSIRISPILIPNIDTIPGFISQKFQYSKRSKSVSFYCQYLNSKIDSASLILLFYKGSTLDTNNIIGKAIINISPNTQWTYFNKDIYWSSSLNPDTASITILTSQNKKDTLFIDDISISDYSVKINSLKKETDFFRVYINSNEDLIFLPETVNKKHIVKIKSNVSSVILEEETNLGFVNVRQLPSGIYFYEIISEQGFVYIGKFVK